MKTDPKGIDIIPGSFTLCKCGGMPAGGKADLMIPMPKEGETLEGEHDAMLVCPKCKAKIPCRVKIDLRRHEHN